MAQSVFAEASNLNSKLTLKKIWQISSETKFENYKVGGLSGCSKIGDEIYFVSDDRGQQGVPRILILKYDSQKSELNTTDLKWLTVKFSDKKAVLDMEGIARLSSDRTLVSSEGDLNQKPRQPVELFWINNKGERLTNVALPQKFLANASGLQVRGAQNNKGFEGLSLDSTTGLWGAILEGPLLQDPKKLLMIEGSVTDSVSVVKEWTYPLPHYIGEGLGAEMGVTDFVYDKNQNLITIERGVSLSLNGVQFDVQMCLAEKVPSTKSIKTNCFYDFAKDKTLKAQVKEVQNYEGICWLNDQKTQFMVINDNNFSKSENNLFLLYQID